MGTTRIDHSLRHCIGAELHRDDDGGFRIEECRKRDMCLRYVLHIDLQRRRHRGIFRYIHQTEPIADGCSEYLHIDDN